MTEQEQLVYRHLSQFVSEHKKQFVDKVLSQRTRYITVVLEDIYQSQNASAAIRTCECMGLQDIHIIEQESKYEINRRVLKGANKWMDLYQYNDKGFNNTKKCFETLHDNGYQILVADPDYNGVDIDNIVLTENKIAILFGNELRGASRYAKENCDQKIKIPMYGFTESLNISVSVAICLNTFISQIHKIPGAFFLSEKEKAAIKLQWYRKIVRRSELIEREFLRVIE